MHGTRRALLRGQRVVLTVYSAIVRALAAADLLSYWILGEASGVTAADSSGHAYNGSYTAVTLAEPGVGDINTSAKFDGTTSYVNVYTTGLRDNLNGAEGSVMLWMRVADGTVWTDGLARSLFRLRVNASNSIQIERSTSNGRLNFSYIAGGVTRQVPVPSLSNTTWMCLLMTWSKSADELKAYINGVQVVSTVTGLGTWAGTIAVATSVIGATSTVPASVWSGWIAHVAVWGRALSAGNAATLAALPPLVIGIFTVGVSMIGGPNGISA